MERKGKKSEWFINKKVANGEKRLATPPAIASDASRMRRQKSAHQRQQEGATRSDASDRKLVAQCWVE